MEDYLMGCDILGADVIPLVGPSYTDAATVRAVQVALRDKGFDPGPIDGIFGPKTASGIRAMQSATGVPQTGVIDYGVLQALGVQAPSSAPKITVTPSGGYAKIMATTPSVEPAKMPAWKWAAIAGGSAALLTGIIVLVRR